MNSQWLLEVTIVILWVENHHSLHIIITLLRYAVIESSSKLPSLFSNYAIEVKVNDNETTHVSERVVLKNVPLSV